MKSGDGAAGGGMGGCAMCDAIDWWSCKIDNCMASRVLARSKPTKACIAAAGCCRLIIAGDRRDCAPPIDSRSNWARGESRFCASR
jgi:hypothetical protein